MSPKLFYCFYFISLLFVSFAAFPHGAAAVLISLIISVPLIIIFNDKKKVYSEQLLNVFLVALVTRIFISTTIYSLELTNFFAFDWQVYDWIGGEVADYLTGAAPMTETVRNRVFSFKGTTWGISLLTGIIYSIVGKEVISVQLFIASLGAVTAPVTYLCAYQIYKNQRTATIAGYIVALMPSMILWSSIILKDGLMVLFLVLAMYSSSKLQEKFSHRDILILIFSLIGVMSMRFFIFYMVAVAVVGGFIIGQKNTTNSILARGAAVIVIGVIFGYIGILNNANLELQQMTSLEDIQSSRNALATTAESGFGEEYDVSTLEGAIAVLPLGFTYLLLSPLPWQITSSLAMSTMPEMVIWWSMIPFMISGIIYSFRKKLRECISIMVFTLMLTIGYSILQGNVGTAYRQRAQIQVFLFIFIAVGITLVMERRENQKILGRIKEREFKKFLKDNQLKG